MQAVAYVGYFNTAATGVDEKLTGQIVTDEINRAGTQSVGATAVNPDDVVYLKAGEIYAVPQRVNGRAQGADKLEL